MTSTSQANLMNKTYEILKPMTIEELKKAKSYSYEFTGYYLGIYMHCIDETIRRKQLKIWG